MMARLREVGQRARQVVGSKVVIGSFNTLSRLGAQTPLARPAVHGVEVLRDIPYVTDGNKFHTLDVYRPKKRTGPLPAVVYFHGGAFQFLSKDTHWLMGLAFARRGYVLFNVNYRLAPRDKFPAAVEDACTAALWVREHAAEYGGDPDRILVAGESAGGNLAAALMIASCYERPEPYARAVFDSGLQFQAVAPACGMLQVSDPGRFGRRRKLSPWLTDRLEECALGYLPSDFAPEFPSLADPLLILESLPPDRSLPPVFAFAGTADPLLDDTRRLKRALDAHGATCEARYYRGGLHAFHALVWEGRARQAWKDQLSHLEAWVAGGGR